MKADRWQQIDQLFHLALEQEPGRRAAFLAEACATDKALLGEVQELISSHEQAESFIEAPASDLAAALLGERPAGLSAGEMIGPYQVESVLGIGGMGEVYRALDTRLGRRVALKLLPRQFTIDADRVRRFEQEARAASALNHPNIVTIHEIGRLNNTRFIVTEFVEGKTLRQLVNENPFTLNEALNVAIQIAGALTAAHAVGIVHRDIKPENIMLRADGYVKILDFGLAKLTESANIDSDTEGPTLLRSNPGLVMGTVQYMSPEQARGKKVDARSDIWSLGVVLYELLAGRVPFSGETPSHVMVSLMENEPPPLSDSMKVPPELERIVTRALTKNKNERYQTARDLARDLKSFQQRLEVERLKGLLEPETAVTQTNVKAQKAISFAPTSAAHTTDLGVTHPTSSAEYLVAEIKRHKRGVALAVVGAVVAIIAIVAISYSYFNRKNSLATTGESIDSVAVLPFVNATNDPNTEYLAEGISESVINSLSRLPSLKVVSLNSVLRYKGKQVDPQTVGRQLNVRALLMGRMTQRADDLTISTELIDVRDNRRLWGEQYSRKLADILAVQNEIARETAERLRRRLTGADQQQLAKRNTDNTKAYEFYTLGMYHSRKETREDLYKSIEFFEQAIKVDPNYALAYTGLVRTYGVLGQRGFWYSKEAHQKAEWAALKAVEIDDTLAGAHAVLGYVKKSNWDWAGAEREFKRALELDPNHGGANFLYSVHLMQLGRTDEALVYAQRAEELGTPEGVPQALLYAREFDRAIELLLKTQQDRAGHPRLAECYLGKGMYEEAIAQSQKIVARDNAPEKWQGYPLLAYAYAKASRRDEAVKILNAQKRLAKRGYISPYNFAVIYTGLGNKDKAFEYLNKAYEEFNANMPHFPKRPMFDSLHSDPRYTELLRKINYPM